MIFIIKNTWKSNGIEVIIVNNVKWLNEKHLEIKLGHSNLSMLTLKNAACFEKQRCELIDNKYQPCRRFIREDLAIQLIIDTRTLPSIDFKNKLGFYCQDPILTQEQSILTKIKDSFSTEKIIFQHFVLGYKIDAYFLKHKLAIEVDERGHNDRDLEYEIEREKSLERKLDCKYIRINPAIENFNIFNEISKIHHHIIESEKNYYWKIFQKKKKNSIKTKCLKRIVKKIFCNFY